MNELEKKINNASYLTKDLIEGDTNIVSRLDFKELSFPELQEALNLLINNKHIDASKKRFLLSHSWKIHYHEKPPTIQEFLTEKWLGPTANTLFKHNRKILNEYWEPNSIYRNLILATSIGTGKTSVSAICLLYIIVHLVLIRDYKKFFSLAKSSSIVLALISFTLEKAGQVLLQKIIQILISTPLYRRVKMEERLVPAKKENPDQLIWTTAGRMGKLQFENDIHVITASDPAQLLGLDMIAAVLSEISFFLEKGFSTEYIWRIYNDTKGRIYSRFGYKYLTTCILDSSPNDIDESPIDKYIFEGEAYKDKRNYIVTGAHWKFLPEKYPIWQKTKETFPVFKGDSGKPAQIVNEADIKSYNKDELFFVPIDVKQLFIDNPIKAVKDYCGYPAGSLNKLISDYQIIENIFDDSLFNVYSHIYAPSTAIPENLIWNQIYNKFFIEINGRYEFYRAPSELRYIHIDQSETGDITGISMCHPEVNKKGEITYILDFTLAISPKKDRINLEAIPCFIEDLVSKGHVNIKKVTFDRYQSSLAIQKLKTKGFDASLLSVDSTMNPYMSMIAYMNNNRIKAGRNIYLKNNLKSLREVKTNSGKRKIDHLIGKTDNVISNMNWNTSLTGFYAKDISDSACGAIWNCINDYIGVPKYTYEPITYKNDKTKNLKIEKNIYEQIKELGYSI